MNAHSPPLILALATILVATPTPGFAQVRTDRSRHESRGNDDTTTPVRVQRIGRTDIYHFENAASVYFFEAKMVINADGAPKAYHRDTGRGVDHLANAGSTGNWWGIVTDTGDSGGNPILQGAGDPAPGFYVSGTALQDSTKSNGDQNRYVNSETVPFYVLPRRIHLPVKIGDFGFVINQRNNASSGCIFADIGPEDRIGEGSIALAKALGIQSDPKAKGSEDTYVYVIFSNSAMGWPLDLEFINVHAKALFEKWGGMERLQQVLPLAVMCAGKRYKWKNYDSVHSKPRQYVDR